MAAQLIGSSALRGLVILPSFQSDSYIPQITIMYFGARLIPRLALLTSLFLLVLATASCSRSGYGAEEGECFKDKEGNYEVVDCTSPDADKKILKILRGSSLSITDCPNGTHAMREYDGEGRCIGTP
ncbi:LppU/SCO3897 family protein [Nonomuraea dietziae]|uniref:LppU/SCO3897 family protein n=2 Tax=Nonomuraea dietziae TaxID=65515 RepID=UPI003F4D6ED1